MSDNIISLEAGEDGKLRKKPNKSCTDNYSSLFTDYNLDDTIKEVVLAYAENASEKRSEVRGDIMSNESFDTLFKEIKDDMREREKRSREEMIEREKRFEKVVLSHFEDAKEREMRYLDDAREREERLTNISNNLKLEMNSAVQHVENMKKQNFWGNIALFVGMLAIVITLIVVLAFK